MQRKIFKKVESTEKIKELDGETRRHVSQMKEKTQWGLEMRSFPRSFSFNIRQVVKT